MSPHTSAHACSRLHSHVLQRAVRQVRHATAVRILPILGPQLGVPEKRHHGGHRQLWCRHHQPSGKTTPLCFLFSNNSTDIIAASSSWHRCHRWLTASLSLRNRHNLGLIAFLRELLLTLVFLSLPLLNVLPAPQKDAKINVKCWRIIFAGLDATWL